MPLKVGKSRKTLVENFKTEKGAGKSEDQSWAIAFEQARSSGADMPKKKGKKKKKKEKGKKSKHDFSEKFNHLR